MEIIALDARVMIDQELIDKPVTPFSHLALKPHPEEYVSLVKLKDGTTVTLRPIKPEDEPIWMDLLASCSKESIYARFRYFFFWKSHEVATRYCFIDYDREIAIVAELNQGDNRKLLGVGRLVADPDLEVVEYAILIIDTWQNKGLGGILTDYCIDIAKRWGLERIVAQTTQDNQRMITLFRNRGFQINYGTGDSLVEVTKELTK